MGENIVVYCDERLTNEQIKKLGEKAVGQVSDIYEVRDDELQYYVIDGRCWYDTDAQVEKVLKYIGEDKS